MFLLATPPRSALSRHRNSCGQAAAGLAALAGGAFLTGFASLQRDIHPFMFPLAVTHFQGSYGRVLCPGSRRRTVCRAQPQSLWLYPEHLPFHRPPRGQGCGSDPAALQTPRSLPSQAEPGHQQALAGKARGLHTSLPKGHGVSELPEDLGLSLRGLAGSARIDSPRTESSAADTISLLKYYGAFIKCLSALTSPHRLSCSCRHGPRPPMPPSPHLGAWGPPEGPTSARWHGTAPQDTSPSTHSLSSARGEVLGNWGVVPDRSPRTRLWRTSQPWPFP